MKKLIIITALTFFSFAGFAQSCFQSLDTNFDGFLSNQEYSSLPRTALAIPIKPSFTNVDTDGDGKISRSELRELGVCIITGGITGGGNGSPTPSDPDEAPDDSCNFFNLFDADGNGLISRDEYNFAREQLPNLPSFEEINVDSNNFLTPEEFAPINRPGYFCG